MIFAWYFPSWKWCRTESGMRPFASCQLAWLSVSPGFRPAWGAELPRRLSKNTEVRRETVGYLPMDRDPLMLPTFLKLHTAFSTSIKPHKIRLLLSPGATTSGSGNKEDCRRLSARLTGLAMRSLTLER